MENYYKYFFFAKYGHISSKLSKVGWAGFDPIIYRIVPSMLLKRVSKTHSLALVDIHNPILKHFMV